MKLIISVLYYRQPDHRPMLSPILSMLLEAAVFGLFLLWIAAPFAGRRSKSRLPSSPLKKRPSLPQ